MLWTHTIQYIPMFNRSAKWRTALMVGRTCALRLSSASIKQGESCNEGLRVCVVGSGPAGFYVTKYLLKEPKIGPGLTVDILDRLPTPFGLVRSGVAPDHPEVKAVQGDFEQVALDPRVTFLGNLTLGQDVVVEDLAKAYHIIVLAYGAGGDRKLNVPGAELQGVFPAREFVSWYNGHPEFSHLSGEFQQALSSSDTAVVIGVGNVALDCARVLAKGAKGLQHTDICSHALRVLASVGSSLRRVVVLGRRGHVQASFTIKELRELTRMEDGHCLARGEELEMGRTEASLKEVKSHRSKARIDMLLSEVAGKARDVPSHAKAVELRFLVGLSAVLPQENSPNRVGGVRVERNCLQVDPATGNQRAVGTGDRSEVIPCGLVLGSIGYCCLPVDGVPYDQDKAVISNEGGRVSKMPGMYCSGWARRGPSGIIGTNIADAKSVVAAITEDAINGAIPGMDRTLPGCKGLLEIIGERDGQAQAMSHGGVFEGSRVQGRAPWVVGWDGYKRIDKEEIARGEKQGKPREKMVNLKELIKVAQGNNS
ncbi:unnamed protein product [Discosporangium mesarthrocarpum]